MGRPKKKQFDPARLGTPALRLRVFIREDMIGSGKIEMLRQVDATGSISGAARAMGLSYRRAWTLLDTLSNCFDAPLFETARGGGANAGARLTRTGHDLITQFDRFREQMDSTAAPFLDWIKENQRQ